MYNLTNNSAKMPYSIPLNTLPLHPKRINMEELTVQRFGKTICRKSA